MIKAKNFNPFEDLEIPSEELQKYSDMANETLKLMKPMKKDANMNIRLSEKTMQGLKAKAAHLGIPYQTLAGSILHQYANR